jgi:hypothetical protein
MDLAWITPQTDRRVTCLVVGRAGIGKTSLLRTIPEDEPAFVLSAEAGLLCVRDLIEGGQLTGVEARTMADVRDVLTCLETQEWRERYRWIFVDSLTELSNLCLDETERLHPSADSRKVWYEYSKAFMRTVCAFRDLSGYDVVMTCLERMDMDDSKRTLVTPDIQMSSVRGKMASVFDEVLYMTDMKGADGKPKRIFRTEPFDRRPGKDRSGLLDAVEEPSLAAIKAKILEAMKDGDDRPRPLPGGGV